MLVMAHRVTAGYTTDSMGIWATEVDIGVSAQSFGYERMLVKTKCADDNFKLLLSHSKKKTRPGVDKVKPKGWFEYSLQID